MHLFPFSALVEQDAFKAALLLNAVDPSLGGVLIRGHKGTGKTTAARALARLLPPLRRVAGCPFNSDPADPPIRPPGEEAAPASRESELRPTPFVNLPLNATEDRVAGTLHLEKALATGRRHFEPGLLASAHRGILYVDEVNLLDDHLVDLLLDAAASGVNVVEREGLSFSHPSRFILIGTMNPEEGELRPQFLDRFGLCATAASMLTLQARETILARRLEFERDPEAFVRQWEPEERLLANQIVTARERLRQIDTPTPILSQVVRLAVELQTPGHRAEIAWIKAARAHAAFLERTAVTVEDIATVAFLAVNHRMPASPLDTPASLQERLQRVFGRLTEATPETGDPDTGLETTIPAPESIDEMAEQMQVPGVCAAGSVMLSFIKKKRPSPSLKPTAT